MFTSVRLIFIGVLITTFIGLGYGVYRHLETFKENKQELVQLKGKLGDYEELIRKQKHTDVITKERIIEKEKIRYVTETQIKYINRLPDISIPASYGMLHNAATVGNDVSESTSRSNDSTISTQEIFTTIIENYGICRDNADKLTRLQQWVLEVCH